MLDEFSTQLNNILMATYHSILKIEEQSLKNTLPDLSVNEMHLLETIGKTHGNGRTVSGIAEELGITQPSVTAAVNKLVKKGYVERWRSEEDGRVVYIYLTKKGNSAYALHSYFHENMVRSVVRELTEEEKAHLLKGMVRLNAFFQQAAAAAEEKRRVQEQERLNAPPEAESKERIS